MFGFIKNLLIQDPIKKEVKNYLIEYLQINNHNELMKNLEVEDFIALSSNEKVIDGIIERGYQELGIAFNGIDDGVKMHPFIISMACLFGFYAVAKDNNKSIKLVSYIKSIIMSMIIFTKSNSKLLDILNNKDFRMIQHLKKHLNLDKTKDNYEWEEWLLLVAEETEKLNPPKFVMERLVDFDYSISDYFSEAYDKNSSATDIAKSYVKEMTNENTDSD